jgi:hypothetical protein
MKTSFMNKRTLPKEWIAWINHHKMEFDRMEQAGLNIRYLHTPTLIEGDLSQLKLAVEWLNLDWNEDKVKERISPDKWHYKENV